MQKETYPSGVYVAKTDKIMQERFGFGPDDYQYALNSLLSSSGQRAVMSFLKKPNEQAGLILKGREYQTLRVAGAMALWRLKHLETSNSASILVDAPFSILQRRENPDHFDQLQEALMGTGNLMVFISGIDAFKWQERDLSALYAYLLKPSKMKGNKPVILVQSQDSQLEKVIGSYNSSFIFRACKYQIEV